HSGTRVLAWMCVHLGVKLGTSSPHVEGDPDDVTFTNKIKALAAHNLDVTSPADVREHALRRFKAAVSKYYTGLGNPSGMWGWKFPETYLIAPYVARTFPRARHRLQEPSHRQSAASRRESGAERMPCARAAGSSACSRVVGVSGRSVRRVSRPPPRVQRPGHALRGPVYVTGGKRRAPEYVSGCADDRRVPRVCRERDRHAQGGTVPRAGSAARGRGGGPHRGHAPALSLSPVNVLASTLMMKQT